MKNNFELKHLEYEIYCTVKDFLKSNQAFTILDVAKIIKSDYNEYSFSNIKKTFDSMYNDIIVYLLNKYNYEIKLEEIILSNGVTKITNKFYKRIGLLDSLNIDEKAFEEFIKNSKLEESKNDFKSGGVIFDGPVDFYKTDNCKFTIDHNSIFKNIRKKY